jgi:hypothetical protein
VIEKTAVGELVCFDNIQHSLQIQSRRIFWHDQTDDFREFGGPLVRMIRDGRAHPEASGQM